MARDNSLIKKLLIAIWPAAFLALVTLAVFFTTLVIKQRTFFVFPDNIDQFYAWYQKLAYAVHRGTLPIWDANVSAGHSFVGELQAGVFYPINLLWVGLFGSAHGISVYWLEWLVVFHFWLAAFGMYLAARSFGLRKISSLISAMVFAFSGCVAIRSVSQTAIFFGICYIPWVVFWFNRWLQNSKKLNLLWCSLSLALIILAGHINAWYFSILLAAFLIVFQKPQSKLKAWAKTIGWRFVVLAAVVIGSLIIAWPQTLTSAQYFPQAVRFVSDVLPIGPAEKVNFVTFTQKFSFDPHDIFSLLDPIKYPVVDGNEIYLGLIGLAIILIVLIFYRRYLKQHLVWQKYKWFLIGSMSVAGVIMIGYWTFIPAALRMLPLFSQIRELGRYSIIIQFCLAILVGIGSEILVVQIPKIFATKKGRSMALTITVSLAGFLFLNTVYLYLLATHKGLIDKHFISQNIVILFALLAGYIFRKHLQYVLLLAVVLSSITMPIWFLQKVAIFKATTYPPHYYRRTAVINYLEQFYGKDRALVLDNALPVNTGDVYNIQTVNGYGATLHESFYKFLNEPDAANQPGQHMDFLNVRFIVSKTKQPKLKLVMYDQKSGVYVYERPDYLPRAYFADQLNNCLAHQPDCTNINVDSYGDSDIKLHYQADKPEQLVLSEVNYKGWKAYVDGQPVVITGYGPTSIKLFRSIHVPAGNHNVEFKYHPFGL